jgi:adenylate cyclase
MAAPGRAGLLLAHGCFWANVNSGGFAPYFVIIAQVERFLTTHDNPARW